MKRIPCPVTQQELEALVKQGLTDVEIGALLPDGTGKRVASWRQSFGIEAVPQWARGSPPSLDSLLIPLLVGSMLGDGRLVHQGNSTYFCETHCGKQLPYLQWKADRWGTSWVSSLKEVPDKRGFVSWRMRTRSHKDLTYWRDLFYPDRVAGYKRPDLRLLPYMSAEALALWYLDDGHAGWWPSIAFGGQDLTMRMSIRGRIGHPPGMSRRMPEEHVLWGMCRSFLWTKENLLLVSTERSILFSSGIQPEFCWGILGLFVLRTDGEAASGGIRGEESSPPNPFESP